ncbi:NeuD/PglB/VioB family sugar acetyltransferase [Rufibacter sp. LB8]|uniref:NeuD/PglB/VioB family sugar acetyltransferase n=1 Tax=Rufibacter sp. LB8 TaxID=2777781 RepID=UPI00178C3F55|nr:NeuD/PglB/VioB family sugar acetyltransferase [Rufibacter sp. LB8]
MIVLGAKGHAKDVLSVLSRNQQLDNLCFFDDVSTDLPQKLYDTFPILRSESEARAVLAHCQKVAIGVGGPETRSLLASRFLSLGAELYQVIAASASIGKFDVHLGEGVNIMENVLLTNSINIGMGTLINAGAQLHHDVQVGRFSEISPKALLTGGVTVGNFTSIGASATILPKVQIGDHVVVGAGAVVTKNIPSGCMAVGVPARITKRLN